MIIIFEKGEKNRSFDYNLLTQQHKIKNKSQKENYRNKIKEIKANAPDQHALNLSATTLTEAQKSLLMKVLHSFLHHQMLTCVKLEKILRN